MELLVVRHAIACEPNAKRWPDDGERPLSPRGAVRARRAAAGLKRVAPRPTRVLTSPLRRTRQTAAILRQFAGWPEASDCPLLLPGSSSQGLLTLLARISAERIAVVGHQPDLGHLVATCLPGNAGSAAFVFRKMGVALIVFHGAPRPGQGELRWLVAPRQLRAAR